MTYRQLPIFGLLLTALISAGFVANMGSAPGDPVRINGGRFMVPDRSLGVEDLL